MKFNQIIYALLLLSFLYVPKVSASLSPTEEETLKPPKEKTDKEISSKRKAKLKELRKQRYTIHPKSRPPLSAKPTYPTNWINLKQNWKGEKGLYLKPPERFSWDVATLSKWHTPQTHKMPPHFSSKFSCKRSAFKRELILKQLQTYSDLVQESETNISESRRLELYAEVEKIQKYLMRKSESIPVIMEGGPYPKFWPPMITLDDSEDEEDDHQVLFDSEIRFLDLADTWTRSTSKEVEVLEELRSLWAFLSTNQASQVKLERYYPDLVNTLCGNSISSLSANELLLGEEDDFENEIGLMFADNEDANDPILTTSKPNYRVILNYVGDCLSSFLLKVKLIKSRFMWSSVDPIVLPSEAFNINGTESDEEFMLSFPHDEEDDFEEQEGDIQLDTFTSPGANSTFKKTPSFDSLLAFEGTFAPQPCRSPSPSPFTEEGGNPLEAELVERPLPFSTEPLPEEDAEVVILTSKILVSIQPQLRAPTPRRPLSVSPLRKPTAVRPSLISQLEEAIISSPPPKDREGSFVPIGMVQTTPQPRGRFTPIEIEKKNPTPSSSSGFVSISLTDEEIYQ